MNLLKRFGAMLLALAMVMTMLPVSVMAADGPTVTMNTAAITDGAVVDPDADEEELNVLTETLQVGDVFYVPVELSDISQIDAFNLQFDYAKDILKFTGVATYFTYEYNTGKKVIEIDFAYSLIDGVNPVVNVDEAIVAWATDTPVSGNGCLFYAGFKVIAKSPTGKETISVKSSIDGAGISMTGVTTGEITYVSGEVSVEQAEAAPLSFTNGTQTWNAENYSALKTIMTNGSGLTAPTGGTYYFAGFFSGLTADGTYITEENGYYVLSADAIGTGKVKEFTGVTELRPRYDDMLETGEYNALWLKADVAGQIVKASMRVLPADAKIAVSVSSSNDNTALPGLVTAMLTNDFTAVGANGYVKLLTDLTTNAAVGAENIHLDMHGRKLENVADSTTLTSAATASLRSSYGEGTLNGSFRVKNAEVIRDTHFDSQIAVDDFGKVTLIENCTANIANNSYAFVNLNRGAEVSEISGCNLVVNKFAHSFSYGNSDTAAILDIHDCVITQVSEDELGTFTYTYLFTTQLDSSGGLTPEFKVVLGSNNTITSKYYQALISTNGPFTVEFKDTTNTITSPGGVPFPANSWLTYIMPAGFAMEQADGQVSFVEAWTVRYHSAEGELLFTENVKKGTAVAYGDHVVNYPVDSAPLYKHVGWSLSQGGKQLTGELLADRDLDLYALREELDDEWLTAAAAVTVGEETTFYDSLDAALSYVQNLPSGTVLELDILRDATVTDSFNGKFYIDTKAATFDLNGNTLTFDISSKAIDHGTSISVPFTMKSTGNQGTIKLKGGSYFFGRYIYDPINVTFENIKIDASEHNSGYLFRLWPKWYTSTEALNLTLNNVETVGTTSLIYAWFDRCEAGSTINVHLNGCTLDHPDGTILYSSEVSGSVVNIYVDEETTARVSDQFVTYSEGYDAPNVIIPEGYELVKDTDGWYKLAVPHTCEKNILKSDETGHWYECECGEKGETTAHADETTKDHKCDTCEYVMSEHIYENGKCSICGEVDDGLSDILKLDSMALLLEDDIQIKVYASIMNETAERVETAGLEIWSEDAYNADDDLSNPTTTLTGFAKNGDLYEIVTDGIAAKDMGDTLYIRGYIMVDGEKEVTKAYPYSPAIYCKNKIAEAEKDENLENAEKQALKDLCITLMNYGAEAQKYFAKSGYAYDTLMNDFLTDEQKVWTYDQTKLVTLKTVPGYDWIAAEASKVQLTEASVVLTGALQIKVYASVAAGSTVRMLYWTEATAGEQLTIETAQEMSDVDLNGNVYEGHITGIAAKNMGDTVYVCAEVTLDGETYYTKPIAYSIHQYAANKISANADVADLSKMMVMYSAAAKEYFAIKNN